MGRPRKLSLSVLKKIAKKKGGTQDIKLISKQVDAKARKLGVTARVALIITARGLKIGVQKEINELSDSEKSEFRAASQLPTPISVNHRTVAKLGRHATASTTTIIDYDTKDHFIKGHIAEINRAYNARCYTSVFILTRKVIENLIIDILKKKFPEKTLANRELYFDTGRHRYKDFDVILKNFNGKRNNFGTDNVAVSRLCSLASAFKNDANDKTHSWYHLVEDKSEVEKLSISAIFVLIKNLEIKVGIRQMGA